ncbi:MAG: orotate phosphoribosyltransferase [Methylocella sp.]
MIALEAQQDRAVAERVLDRNDERWRRLRKLVSEHSLIAGDFKLSSGRRSRYLFQLRQTTMLPEGAALLGEVILEYMCQHSIQGIGGLELGAVPLVSSVAVVSQIKGSPINAFFVRKLAKEHGAQERIDGHLRDGAEVLMVDDVATTGGSILKAIEGMGGHGAYVRRALAVVDREEGAAGNLAKQGIQLAAIFKRSDFPEI